jgi:hypothetical protein
MAKVQSLRGWGTHLARLRQNAALSGADVVGQLASLNIRVDRRSIYAYEAGRIAAPDAGLIWGLSKIYGVSVEELISGLVSARTGQKPAPAHLNTPSHESIRVTAEERELVHQIRSLSPKARRACVDFIAFEAQRIGAKRNRRGSLE